MSVQLNIAEGYALRSPRRLQYHLNVAYASATETEELLLLMQEEAILPPNLVDEALPVCQRTARLLLGLLHSKRPTA